MTLTVSPALTHARLTATLAALGAKACVRIYGGARPAAGPDTGAGMGAATDAPLLVEVPLADPPGVILNGEVTLIPANAAGALITASGTPTWARVVARGMGQDGTAEVWLLDCDVSGQSGNGDWQIAIEGASPEGAPEPRLYEGGTFILGAVTLR